ncbi:hypothetical protein BH18THE2_BH18THE2_13920 [soil metagenome]
MTVSRKEFNLLLLTRKEIYLEITDFILELNTDKSLGYLVIENKLPGWFAYFANLCKFTQSVIVQFS